MISVHCSGLFVGVGFGFFLKSLVQLNVGIPSVPLKFHPRF